MSKINKTDDAVVEKETDVKTKNRRPRRHPKGKQGTSHNDPSWYNYNPELVKSAANLSFGEVTGTRLHTPDLPSFVRANARGEYIPAVVMLRLAHTINTDQGNTLDSTDITSFGSELGPATVAARNIYSFVRHANSGHTNYEAPDLFMYLIAKGEAYSAWFFLVRLYGVLNTYDPRNRAYPEALCNMMFINYGDCMGHIADLRYYILSLAKRLNALKTPKEFNYFNRASFRYANLYKDCEDGKAATIVTCPLFFLKWDPDTTAGSPTLGSRLTPAVFSPNKAKLTYTQVKAYFDNLFNPLFADEDIGIISGDIMKAYKDKGGFHELPDIPENLQAYPIYDKNFLNSVRNAKSASSYYTNFNTIMNPTFNWQLCQSGGKITQAKALYTPASTSIRTHLYAELVLGHGTLFNIDSETAEPVDVLEWSAFSTATEREASTDFVFATYCGTEVIVNISISGCSSWSYTGSVSLRNEQDSVLPIPSALAMGDAHLSATPTDQEITSAMSDYVLAMQLATIDYMPITMVAMLNGGFNSLSATSKYEIAYLGDINNYTMVGNDEFKKWNDCRWMSLFNIPAY